MSDTAAEPNSVPISPTTTLQEDMTLAGQRRINVIWEVTQAIIAIIVVLANMMPPLVAMLTGHTALTAPESVTNTLFLVIGFYFSRTNHAAVGGIGSKVESKYTGR